MTALDDLVTAFLAAASKPQSVRNDKLYAKQYSLKDFVELHSYLSSIDAVATAATQVDGETAVMPGVRTNQLTPGGAV